MTRKKVLIFHPALAPYRVDQFNQLNKIYDIHVVFLYSNLWNHQFNQANLVSQLECSYSYLLRGINYKGWVFRFGLFKKIKDLNPDIVISYEYSFTTLYLILLKKFGFISQPLASTIDDSLDICHNVQTKVRLFARHISVKHLNYLILLSDPVSSFYGKSFNIPTSQLITSPILQDSTRLRKSIELYLPITENYISKYYLDGKKALLFIGRLIPEKALYEFIEKTSDLIRGNSDLIFIVVGEGCERKHILELIKSKELEEKIILPGRFEGAELYAWYLCASGFVLPSFSETFGAVINEALIFGVPVLCSQFAGASVLINSENGIIFNPYDKKNTISELEVFVNGLKYCTKNGFEERECMMNNTEVDFNNQWGKLNG